MSTQETAALIESVNQMTATVAGKMAQIDQKVVVAQTKFDNFIQAADSKFQPLINVSAKTYGSHLIMEVSPPDYADPAHVNYVAGSKNGILLWRIGNSNDSKRVRSIGLQGDILLTRFGYENYQKGAFRALRQYASYYSYIDSGLSVALETMTVDGIDYRVLTSNMTGGGFVLLDGFLSLVGDGYSGDSGSIRDQNFGRYVNTKDGSVYSGYAPIAYMPFDPRK